MPILWQRVTLWMPQGAHLLYTAGVLPGATHMRFRSTRKPAAQGVEHRFTWNNVPALRPEAYAPRMTPLFLATNFSTWRQVASWYARLAQASTAPTPALRSQALLLTRGLKTREEKIRTLESYVARKFRYISLSFGLGRVQPHAAAEVYRNGYRNVEMSARK